LEYINEKLEEFKKYIKNKKVAIIGLGVSNIPLLDYLYNLEANITVFDHREENEISQEIMSKLKKLDIQIINGIDCLDELKNFNVIFRSPSCLPSKPELIREAENGALITTEIELLLKMYPGRSIGITGSDGKTTTSSLIYEIVKAGGYNCHLGGNIGTPLFTKLEEMTDEDILILELSSFQLMEMQISPNIAVITNISPNHLDLHNSYDEYIESKKNIFKYQEQNDTLILNYDNEETKKLDIEANGKVIYFSSKSKLDNGIILDDGIIKECKDRLRKHVLNTKDLKLRGIHNYENICAAILATRDLVDVKSIANTLIDFNGVEHRIEFVRENNNVKWYNDSVSSSPTRAIAGINAFDEKIVLIAGGYDKNLDYAPMAKPIVDKVSTLILLGDTSTKIFDVVKEELEKQNKTIPIYVCENLEQTISLANKFSNSGEVVLFSPASASFDMFKNAVERGLKFKELVNKI